jgi:hypothetical protein
MMRKQDHFSMDDLGLYWSLPAGQDQDQNTYLIDCIENNMP